jgi:hypothetical protein
LSTGIWTPVPEGPHEAFVERLHRAIAAFAEEHKVENPFVEVELADGARFVLVRIEPEPGFGMLTLHVRAADDADDAPEAVMVPLGSLKRIELRSAAEERVGVGFSVPSS